MAEDLLTAGKIAKVIGVSDAKPIPLDSNNRSSLIFASPCL